MVRHLLALFAFLIGTASIADQAKPKIYYEIAPNIAEVSMEGDTITVSLRVIAEAHMAGIDLSQVDFTEELEDSYTYPLYRDYSEAQLEYSFTQKWIEFADLIQAQVNGVNQEPIFTEIIVEPEVHRHLARQSLVVFGLKSRQLITEVSLQFSKKLGRTIVKQVGVENGLAQYLEAGQKSESMFFGLEEFEAERDALIVKNTTMADIVLTLGKPVFDSQTVDAEGQLYFYNDKLYICEFNIFKYIEENRQTPSARCSDQIELAKTVYSDEQMQLYLPYLEYAVSVFEEHRMIGQNGSSTLHTAKNALWVCHKDIYSFIACKQNSDPTLLPPRF